MEKELVYNINDLEHSSLISLARRLDELIAESKAVDNKTKKVLKAEAELIKEEVCRRFPNMAEDKALRPESYPKINISKPKHNNIKSDNEISH